MSAHSVGMKVIRATADAPTVTKVQDLLNEGAMWIGGDDNEVGLVYSGKIILVAYSDPEYMDHQVIDHNLIPIV